MQRSDFHYELPKELIAYYPRPERTLSRLLCLDGGSGEIKHRHFYELPDLLEPGDLIVLNNTKVIPARLFGQKHTGGKVEILVERIIDDHQVLALCKASKRPTIGSYLLLESFIRAEVIGEQNDLLLLKLHHDQPVIDLLNNYGHVPLPTYITRPDEVLDKERYQTVFAQYQGSVAAPTAGLHFDQDLMRKLQLRGLDFTYVTLHVGAGTFQPVRVDNLNEHNMHSEWVDVSSNTCEKIHQTKIRGNKIIAVGTTSVRALETAALSGVIKPYSGETRLFIRPGFQFRCVDRLITNFHASESTLLMLVSAFGGYTNIMHAYQTAIQEKYFFFSYGDAMFISRKKDEI